ncbi:MAG TPA: hypothetical protein VMI54_19530 [Polyangiaceae bacterium]|nr:hypothetical protein [Polyangiaceae bacterium]
MKRWLDEGDVAPEVRRLLAAGSGSTPIGTATLGRSRARVAELAALPVAAGVFFWLQQFALGAGLGTAVSLGVAVANGRFSHAEVSEAVRPSTNSPVRGEARKAAPKLVASPSASAAATTESPAVALPEPPHAVVPAPHAAASASVSAPVTAEVALLEQARRVLASDPNRALALLDEHRVRFPHGALGVEREVLAVDALMHAGRRPEAEARAARLRASAPGNLYEERLERILGEGQ